MNCTSVSLRSKDTLERELDGPPVTKPSAMPPMPPSILNILLNKTSACWILVVSDGERASYRGANARVRSRVRNAPARVRSSDRKKSGRAYASRKDDEGRSEESVVSAVDMVES